MMTPNNNLESDSMVSYGSYIYIKDEVVKLKYNKKNELYRDRDEMIQDLFYLFNCKDISDGSRMALINNILFEWTEYHGKFVGCKLWSRSALELWSINRSDKGLRHEHIVPRNIVREILIGKYYEGNLNPDIIRKIFLKYLIGVVVTKKQDELLTDLGYKQIMPDEFYIKGNPSYQDEWLRYRIIGHDIEVCHVFWKKMGRKLIYESKTHSKEAIDI